MTDDYQTYGVFRGTASRVRDVIRLAAIDYHDDVLLRCDEANDAVHVIAQSGGRQVMSYCSFRNLSAVEGDGIALLPTGVDKDTKGVLDYLDLAEGSDTVEVRLKGPEDATTKYGDLATYFEAEGSLEVGLRLPGSVTDLSKVPWELAHRFDDGRYLSRDALDDDGTVRDDLDDVSEFTPPTTIETTAGSIRQQIIKPVEFMDRVSTYPIVVEDGAFEMFVEKGSGDDWVTGEINAESVAGPDVDRRFDQGFAEVFAAADGPVTLATAPVDEAPLIVTQTSQNARKIRHVLGPYVED